VYACNVNEDMMNATEEELKKNLWLENSKNKVVPICAKLEEDMIWMAEDEKKEFLTEMWLKSTGLDDLIKASYDALWLMYYFTAWEMEVRAWTIHKGDTAPKAAGVIHTDFEKWFIKADVVNWKDLVEFGWWTKAREAGKVGLEWKDYIVKDGDVMLFKFNN
jgi:ribosome-binding ATPase YchF (GTP1/OBG family)